jgi:hypothetical protein
MRRLITPFLLLVFIFGQAQDNDSKDINICIECGFTGTSTDVIMVQQLATSKTYILLKRKLFSHNKRVAVLSAITLQELETKRLLFLTNEERQRMEEIRGWSDKYSVLQGCTMSLEGTVNELLTNKLNPAYLLISRTVLKTVSAANKGSYQYGQKNMP